MIRGVYRAAAAMLAEMVRQDIHANNLANVETTGFKRSLARVVSDGERNTVSVQGETDVSQGDLRMTSSPLDVALQSRGYFVVNGRQGRQYTRDGGFSLAADGSLVNSQGNQVLGLRGPIRLNGGQVRVTDNGAVYSDGTFVDKLMIVDFPGDTDLQVAANSMLQPDRQPVRITRYQVVQGALEDSNASPVTELSAMRNGFRIYEANARTIEQLDRSLSKLIEASTG